MNLNYATDAATLAAVLLAAIGLWHGIRTYKNQTNLQVFTEYAKRYDDILQSFPKEALSTRLDLLGTPPDPSEELSLAVLRYLNLCSEEYYLYDKGILSKKVWDIWEAELKRTLTSALLRREWAKLEVEFETYSEFKKYVNEIQE